MTNLQLVSCLGIVIILIGALLIVIFAVPDADYKTGLYIVISILLGTVFIFLILTIRYRFKESNIDSANELLLPRTPHSDSSFDISSFDTEKSLTLNDNPLENFLNDKLNLLLNTDCTVTKYLEGNSVFFKYLQNYKSHELYILQMKPKSENDTCGPLVKLHDVKIITIIRDKWDRYLSEITKLQDVECAKYYIDKSNDIDLCQSQIKHCDEKIKEMKEHILQRTNTINFLEAKHLAEDEEKIRKLQEEIEIERARLAQDDITYDYDIDKRIKMKLAEIESLRENIKDYHKRLNI